LAAYPNARAWSGVYSQHTLSCALTVALTACEKFFLELSAEATATKGKAALDSLVSFFADHLKIITSDRRRGGEVIQATRFMIGEENRVEIRSSGVHGACGSSPDEAGGGSWLTPMMWVMVARPRVRLAVLLGALQGFFPEKHGHPHRL
jgi:hypothetical protein